MRAFVTTGSRSAGVVPFEPLGMWMYSKRLKGQGDEKGCEADVYKTFERVEAGLYKSTGFGEEDSVVRWQARWQAHIESTERGKYPGVRNLSNVILLGLLFCTVSQ